MANTSTRPRRGSAYHLTPAFDLFRPSYQLVRKHIWIFGPLFALPLIFEIHDWIWTPVRQGHHSWWLSTNGFSGTWGFGTPESTYAWSSVIGFSILWFLIVVGIGTIVKIMTQQAQLEVSEGKSPDLQRLWGTVKELGWRMVGLYLLVAAITIIGFFLLIIPGIIMLRRYFLAPYVMLDQKTGIMESMEKSAAMSKPHAGSIYSVIGVTILFALVSIVPIIGWLASFLLSMFYCVAPALRYQELKKLA